MTRLRLVSLVCPQATQRVLSDLARVRLTNFLELPTYMSERVNVAMSPADDKQSSSIVLHRYTCTSTTRTASLYRHRGGACAVDSERRAGVP